MPDLPRAAAALTRMARALEKLETDAYADLRGEGRPGRKPRAIVAVNDYQRALEAQYRAWADETAHELAEVDDDARDEILAAALLALLALLRRLGRERLPEAVDLGLDDEPLPADVARRLADAIDENDEFLEESLIPAVGEKARRGLADPDVQIALGLGLAAGSAALRAVFGTLESRVASYSGRYWNLLNHSVGHITDERGQKLRAFLDPAAQHCSECPQYHSTEGREYESFDAYLAETGGRAPGEFECGPWCRCWLESG